MRKYGIFIINCKNMITRVQENSATIKIPVVPSSVDTTNISPYLP